MISSKRFAAILILCFVQECLSKPTNPAESDLTQGRGIGSTIWGWITYPFSWWSSAEPELPPIDGQLAGSTTFGPYDSIEIGKHNVTVWCNDQTCTTMKCDKYACRNITCSIYDTDMMGECREYNFIPKPEGHIPKPTESVQNKVTENPINTPESSSIAPVTSTQKESSSTIEEHPLELEAALSSTVNGHPEELPGSKVDANSSPQNKV